MALEVFMPRLTHDMRAGILVEWYKKEGDEVKKGEPLFAVETDKTTVEVEADGSGVLKGVRLFAGDSVPVGEVMAWIAAPGEGVPETGIVSAPGEKAPGPGVTPAPGEDVEEANAAPIRSETEKAATPSSPEAPEASSPAAGGRIVASPLAKRTAREHGVDLGQIKGRGPHGRVTEADVQASLAQQATAAATALPLGEVPYDVVPLSRLRQTIGERMVTSARTIPHFDLEVEVDMNEANHLRALYAEVNKPSVSHTALLVKVVARAMRKHPQVNAAFVDGELRLYREINIGVAMAVEEGLVAPVIRRADEMTLSQIQESLSRLRDKARGLRFAPEEVSGGTFTLSNLGMYGIDAFRAIINPPEAAILAVGRIVERPVGLKGHILLRPMARMILSVDHRVLDGAQAAPFLVEVRRLLENPYLLL